LKCSVYFLHHHGPSGFASIGFWPTWQLSE
jgi:hypothetical protein